MEHLRLIWLALPKHPENTAGQRGKGSCCRDEHRSGSRRDTTARREHEKEKGSGARGCAHQASARSISEQGRHYQGDGTLRRIPGHGHSLLDRRLDSISC